jgi:hypothetical protein
MSPCILNKVEIFKRVLAQALKLVALKQISFDGDKLSKNWWAIQITLNRLS